MSDASRTSGRISIDSSLHDFYKELSEGNNIENTPFRTMKDIFMLAMCLGYRSEAFKPITGAKRQIFHWPQFSEQIDVPILKAIAIAKTGDIMVLGDQEKIVHIAEAYANAGVQQLHLQITEQHAQPLWNLVNLLRT